MKNSFIIFFILYSLTLNAQHISELKCISIETSSKKILIDNKEPVVFSMKDIIYILGKPDKEITDTSEMIIISKNYTDGMKESSDWIINKSFIYDSLGIIFRTKNFMPGNFDSLRVDLFVILDKKFNYYISYTVKLNPLPQNSFQGVILLNGIKLHKDIEPDLVKAGIKSPFSDADKNKEININKVDFKIDFGTDYQINYWGEKFSIELFLNETKNVISMVKISKM